MTNYLGTAAKRSGNPPQSEPLDERQVKNAAGGYTFVVDDFVRLDRFLILGSEGGSYYASEKKLTTENIDAVKRCVAADGLRTVARIVELSDSGRAPKNDPALLALAYAASKGDDKTRHAAINALPDVARIGTHLFHFVTFARSFRGWGRGLRRGIENWYTTKTPDRLAEQVVKYQQRDGWSHRDLMRLRHTKFEGPYNAIMKWVVKGEGDGEGLPKIIEGHIKIQEAKTPEEAAKLIREYGLVRESVPTEMLKYATVWSALLEKMPMTAMIRNLGNLSKCGLLTPLSDAEAEVAGRIDDEAALKKARVHPIQILMAEKVYETGRGVRGHGEWKVSPKVVDALDSAFYKAFQNVEPTGKNFYLAVDVSGSMSGGEITGAPGLTPCAGAAAMAMTTAHSEENYYVAGFSQKLVEISVTKKDKLTTVMRKFQDRNFGGTDTSVAIEDAQKRKMKVDAFVVYTDGMTWAGDKHTSKALEEYRQKMSVPARLIVCNMVSSDVTIADPTDAGSLDVVGFDTATPQIISSFASGLM
jgi:60 kDa SS-A/Ro ribonucleoprotein